MAQVSAAGNGSPGGSNGNIFNLKTHLTPNAWTLNPRPGQLRPISKTQAQQPQQLPAQAQGKGYSQQQPQLTEF